MGAGGSHETDPVSCLLAEQLLDYEQNGSSAKPVWRLGCPPPRVLTATAGDRPAAREPCLPGKGTRDDPRQESAPWPPGRGREGREEGGGTWDVQVSEAIASGASHHMGPAARALDVSDPAPCACGRPTEGGHSCKDMGETYGYQRDKPQL